MNISIMGIGGQGVVTIGKILATALAQQGLPVALSVEKGSTQKGGPVRCDIKCDKKATVYDAVIMPYERRDWVILHQSVLHGDMTGNIWLNSHCYQGFSGHAIHEVDAQSIVRERGSQKGENMVLLGAYVSSNKEIHSRVVETVIEAFMAEKLSAEWIELFRTGEQLSGLQEAI